MSTLQRTPNGTTYLPVSRGVFSTEATGKLVNIRETRNQKSYALLIREADGIVKSVVMPITWGVEFPLIVGQTIVRACWTDQADGSQQFSINEIDANGEVIPNMSELIDEAQQA